MDLSFSEADEREASQRSGDLLGHGHREFRTIGDAVGPALHDALVARVKAHRFLAVRMMIAEQDRKSTRLNSSHSDLSRMPSSA